MTAPSSITVSKAARLGVVPAARSSLSVVSSRAELAVGSLRSSLAVVEHARGSLTVSKAARLAALPPRDWALAGPPFVSLRVGFDDAAGETIAAVLGSVETSAPVRAVSAAFEPALLPAYTPGPNRPSSRFGLPVAFDRVRVTDSAGTFTDWEFLVTSEELGMWSVFPVTAAIGVGFGEEGEAFHSVVLGQQVQCGAEGGTGPYTYALTRNETGATLDASGLYTPGSVLGEDIVTVTDAVGGMAPITIGYTGNIVPLDCNRIASGLAADAYFQSAVPRAWPLQGVGGTGLGYSVELLSTESGAVLAPGHLERVVVQLVDRSGYPASGLDAWTFDATLRAADWSVLLDDLPVVVVGGSLAVEFPTYDWSTPVVLFIAASHP